jgi:signal transduction histidine kinase
VRKVPLGIAFLRLAKPIRPLGRITMSRSSEAGICTSAGVARSDWSMELGEGDRRPLRYHVLFLYGTGLAIGLHLALVQLYVVRHIGMFFFTLAATLVFSTATLFLWLWVLPRVTDRRFAPSIGLQLVISILAFALISFVATEVSALLFDRSSLLRPYAGEDRVITIPSEALRRAPLVLALIPIGPTALICVVGFHLYWRRMLALQGRERELRELALAAQLAALRAQVNPHFFFNSLNSIAQLISSDPAKAEVCVERLAEIFRYILRRTEAEFVPFEEELKVAEAYLDIERARFGDDLVVKEEIDERARAVMLPGLILQPLVENAVRHGISQKIGGGVLHIGAQLEADRLRLTVRDTGVGIGNGDSIFERGVGLRNVRERLVKHYGPAAAPAVSSALGEGTTISICIPLALPAGAAP